MDMLFKIQADVGGDWCRAGLKPVEIEGRADFATTFNFRSTLR